MASSSPLPYPLAIIGGGITGLSAAWQFQQMHTQADQRPARYLLLESADRWGGKVVTERVSHTDGTFLIDGGPESFVTRKPEVWQLAQALGLSITVPASETSGMHILQDGQAHRAPLSPVAFVTSRLLSPLGKLRLLAEPFMPTLRDGSDESLSSFAQRRLGREASEKLIGPILSGIYNADPHEQSILVSSPIMRDMESRYGSLSRAMLARLRAARKAKRTAPQSNRPPQFIALRDGAESLVDALVSRLNGELHLNAAVRRITREAHGYCLHLADGRTFTAEAVLLATTANVAADLLRDVAPDSATELQGIRHSSIGTASLAFRESDLPSDNRRSAMRGLMIPRRERRALDAIQWTSARMPERAPAGYALLRVFFGGARPEMTTLDPDALLREIRAELAALLGIHAEPALFRAYRWPNQYPLADVGHLERVARLERDLPAGLFVAGSSYRGVGVPDCIRQGQQAAQQVAGYVAAFSPATEVAPR